MAFPKVGNMAPAFKLKNQSGQDVALKDFKGKKNVVVYFYPRAMTPGCTVQACGIRDSEADFARLDTVVLAISPDPVSKLQKFADKEQLAFHLLSDEPKIKGEAPVTAKKYGVWALKKFMGRESMGILRTTFIIGKDGKLKHIMDKVKTKTHHDDTLQWIRDHLS
ncbi:MAG: thioredoxin-dependent thiol peroxidase [Pseudomonadales bacterium]|nr:thioredoxin-dependent thiol peroxidase [Pseudomonadales bacterium]